MKQMIAIALILVFLFSIASHAANNAQESKGERSLPDKINGLHLSVELIDDEKNFRRADTFRIRVKLKNVSQSPITLYKEMSWGWLSSLFLGISDGRGRKVDTPFLEHAFPHPPFPKEDFIAIRPGEAIEKVRDVELKLYEIRKPGTYFVTVWYRSPVPQEFAPEGMKIWAMEEGRLESKPVKFRIIM
ncbi:MAG TPA: hypothetical protein VIQ24_00610 [Pyrinomonadaceae bacterium]